MQNIGCKLPTNAVHLIRFIHQEGPKTQKQLSHELTLTLRALRYALDRLEKRGFLVKRANLSDMRSLYYVLTIPHNEVEGVISQELGTPLASISQEEAIAGA